VFFFPASGNNNCITLSYLLLLLVNVLLFYQLIGAFLRPYQNCVTNKPIGRDRINACKAGLEMTGASTCVSVCVLMNIASES
jgi:hypothetical protein